MPEVVTRYRTIHRDDDKSPRMDYPAGTKISLPDEHAKRLMAREAAVNPRQAEREAKLAERGDADDLERQRIAGRDPGNEAEARAAAESAARAAAVVGADANVSREQASAPHEDEL